MDERAEIIARCYQLDCERLVNYACRSLADRAEAEDLVQDAFLRLLTSKQLLASETISSLAFNVLRRLLIDAFRRRECRKHCALTPLQSEDASGLCSLHEVEEWLERGMARLSPDSREVYRLHVLGGMKISEIQRVTHHDYKQLEYSLGVARRTMRHYMRRLA